MYSHALNLNLLQRSILPIHLHPIHPGQRLEPLVAQHMSKDRILVIQVRRRRERDEELAPVRVRAFVRHAHDAPRVVPQRGAELVLEGFVPDGGAAFWGGGGGAGLDDEVGDEAVEGGGVVVAGGAKGEEVLGRWLAGGSLGGWEGS